MDRLAALRAFMRFPRFSALTFIPILVCGLLPYAARGSGPSGPLENASGRVTEEPTFHLAFAAKGTNVGIDAGLVEELFDRVPALRNKEIIATGSSSGSIMAALLGCYGMTNEALEVMRATFKVFDKSKIDMDPALVLEALKHGWADRLFQPRENLDPILDALTKGHTCLPSHPMVIAAANTDVVDARQQIIGTRVTVPFTGSFSRWLDMRTNVVLSNGWNPARERTYLGRSCTYFVDVSMMRRLTALSSDEVLCDLRLIETPADLELAIRASVSEPTYFAPVADPRPDRIRPATYRGKKAAGPSMTRQRLYNGGFVMTIVSQDIKRAVPGVFTLGTGRTYFDFLQDKLIRNWYSVFLNESIDRQRWWLDAEIPWTVAEWNEVGAVESSVASNIALGRKKMASCFTRKFQGTGSSCLPAKGRAPVFVMDATGRVDMRTRVQRGMKAFPF